MFSNKTSNIEPKFPVSAQIELRQFFEEVARPINLPGGRVLFEQGSPGDALYLLDNGALEISVISPDGRRLALNKLVAGDLLGEISFFRNGARSATATASGPTRLLCIDRKSFNIAVTDHPNIALNLLQQLGARLAWISERQVEQLLCSVEARLARRIVYLAGRNDRGSDVVELTQSELAEHLGVSREKVGRVLSGWRKQDWIETKRAYIVIREHAPLLALSNVPQ